MVMQRVSGQRKFYKYKECEKGQKLVDEGTYLGAEEGKFGIIHVFRQKDGECVVLNSAGHLNWLLDTHADTGNVCNVYYDGKVMLTKGTFKGKESHNFILEVDDVRHSDTGPAPISASDLFVNDGTGLKL